MRIPNDLLSPRAALAAIAREPLHFWTLCGYVIVEYVRPQSIFPVLSALPWGQIFIALTVLGLISSRSVRWVRDPANLLINLFLLVLILSFTVAAYPDLSARHWFDFFGWYVIYFVIINTLTTRNRFYLFLLLYFLANFKMSFFGARTWAGRGFSYTNWGIMGPPGPFQNSGEFAVQMLMFGAVAVAFARALAPTTRRWTAALLWTLPVTAAMSVLGASSRGAQVALLYQAYRLLIKGRVTLRSALVTALVIALAVAVFPAEQLDRFREAGTDDTSQQRLLYWKRGLQMIEDHPVLGVGYYNFAPYFQAHYPQDMLRGAAQLPHNIFIQVGTDAGLLGLGVFLALIIRNAQICRKFRSLPDDASPAESLDAAIASGLLVALWGFVIAGQFVTITYYPFFWINIAMSVALLNVSKRKLSPEPRPERVPTRGRRTI